MHEYKRKFKERHGKFAELRGRGVPVAVAAHLVGISEGAGFRWDKHPDVIRKKGEPQDNTKQLYDNMIAFQIAALEMATRGLLGEDVVWRAIREARQWQLPDLPTSSTQGREPVEVFMEYLKGLQDGKDDEHTEDE